MDQPRKVLYTEPWHEPGCGDWINFDTDPDFGSANAKSLGECNPCLYGMLAQLSGEGGELALGPAYSCWKLSTTTPNDEQSRKVIDKLASVVPERIELFGKYGETGSKSIIIIYTNEAGRVTLGELLGYCLLGCDSDEIEYSKGCSDIHGELFGPWKD